MRQIGIWRWIFILSMTILAACTQTGIVIPPSEEDKPAAQDAVSIEQTQILLLESFPVQVMLELEGYMPTPCHTLQWEVSEPDAQRRIEVEVWAVVESEVLCIQVVERFEQRIPLGDYTEGAFSVWVNGERVGTFEI